MFSGEEREFIRNAFAMYKYFGGKTKSPQV